MIPKHGNAAFGVEQRYHGGMLMSIRKNVRELSPWIYASSGDSRREYDDFKSEIGRWFDSLGEWQWFVTCTLDVGRVSEGFTMPGVGVARACLRELLCRSGAKRVICVFERTKAGIPHLHALLAGCDAIRAEAAQVHMFKTFGMARFKVYAEKGGAAGYLGKYLGKEMIELYMGFDGPWKEDDFKVFTGGLTKKGTKRFNWDTSMGGLLV